MGAKRVQLSTFLQLVTHFKIKHHNVCKIRIVYSNKQKIALESLAPKKSLKNSKKEVCVIKFAEDVALKSNSSNSGSQPGVRGTVLESSLMLW